MDKRTLGGWLSGPGSGLPDTTQDYRGQRLGLTESGPGSVAGVGRRLAAIALDWWVALLIVRLVFPGVDRESESDSLLVLLTFWAIVTVLTWLAGASLGQRLLGIQVVRLGGDPRVTLPLAALRTGLICLVIPAVVFDRDQRGLHDKAAGTVTLRVGRAARNRGTDQAA